MARIQNLDGAGTNFDLSIHGDSQRQFFLASAHWSDMKSLNWFQNNYQKTF
jgi:hypothetical protein